jgi:glycosyltransferase involved in cell wall biosynthesis
MKALILSPVPSHPPTAGNTARILALGDELRRQGHAVWFLHADFQRGDAAAMREHWGERYVHHSYQRPWKKHRLAPGAIPIPDRWHGWFVRRGLAYQTLDHYYDPSLDETLRTLHGQQKFDVVFCEYVFFSKALEAFPPGVRKLLDTHDVYSNRHRLFRANSQSPEWFYTTPGEERRGLMRADCVLAIQDQEKRFFEKLSQGRREVVTVGHFVEPKPCQPSAQIKTLLFAGSGNTLNVLTIRKFLAEIWPRLRARVPGIRLLIAGGVCEHLTGERDVTLLGVVDPVDKAYRQAQAAVNPILFGTGLKIKSLEALAFGLPLVTTPCGAEGMEEGAGRAFISASSGEAFCDAVVALCNNPEQAAGLARGAAEFARDYRRRQELNLMRAIAGPAKKQISA